MYYFQNTKKDRLQASNAKGVWWSINGEFMQRITNMS